MKFEKQTEAVKEFFKKLGKRNLVIICAVFLALVTVTANVIYFSGKNDDVAASGDGGEELRDAGETYFTATQLSRQRARDEAIEVLQNVVDDVSADDSSRAAALADISRIAKDMENEANIETLVMAKGFARCVAVIGTDSVNVVVDAGEDGLNAGQIAQINTIVYEQTGLRPDKVVIIEK